MVVRFSLSLLGLIGRVVLAGTCGLEACRAEPAVAPITAPAAVPIPPVVAPRAVPQVAAVFPVGGSWKDLTHPFDAGTIYWPTEKGFLFEAGNNGPTAKGYYYAANRFTAAEHGGTHLDAPRHFSASGDTADAIPLEKLIGEGVVIDVTAQCAADPAYEITADDLVAWETAHQRPLVDVIVLLRTGWGARWGNRTSYLGTEATGTEGVAQLRFPGLAPLAARWLADHRRVRGIGIDTASIDHGPSTHFGSHVALCGRQIPIFENVAELTELPEEGAFVVALPMKIAGGSGGPLRIVAWVPPAKRP